jgi:hypothetical protein
LARALGKELLKVMIEKWESEVKPSVRRVVPEVETLQHANMESLQEEVIWDEDEVIRS